MKRRFYIDDNIHVGSSPKLRWKNTHRMNRLRKGLENGKYKIKYTGDLLIPSIVRRK